MRFHTHKLWMILALSAAVLLNASAAACAEENAPPAASVLARLRRLKEENPEAFQRLVQERKQQIKSKFREFRQTQPEKFEVLRQKVLEERIGRLQRLQKENPGRFRQVMGERMQKFERWKNENSEPYQRFIKNHPRFEERIHRTVPGSLPSRLQRPQPQKPEEFLRHPRAGQRPGGSENDPQERFRRRQERPRGGFSGNRRNRR